MRQNGELKAGGVYSFVGVAQTLIWVILLPIQTHFLSQEDYGLIALCTAIIVGLATVLEFGLSRATAHTRFLNRNSSSTLQSELATPIRFLMFIAIVMLGIAIAMDWLGMFSLDQVSFPVITLTVGAAVVLPIIRVYSETLKMETKFKQYAKLMFIVMGINFCSNLMLVAVFKMGPAGVLWSILLANWIGMGIVLFAIRRYLTRPIDWLGLKNELTYGMPLVLHFSIGSFMPIIERGLLSYLIGLQAVGIYAVATSLSNILTIVTTSITTALRPRIFYLLENNTNYNVSKLSKIMLVTVCGFICLAIAGALLSEPAVKLLTDERFHGAWLLVPLLLIRQAIYGAYQFVASVFYYVREGTQKLVLVSGVAVLILIIGNFILVPTYGIKGMVYTSVVVAFSYLFSAALLGKKLHFMRWPIIQAFGLLLLGGVFVLGAFLPLHIRITEMIIALVILGISMKILQSMLSKVED